MSRVGSARLVNRVALGAALSAALAGGVAAASAGLAARELVGNHEQAALRAAVNEMAGELREALEEDADDGEPEPSMDARLLHELDDLKIAGATAALRKAGHTLAGDPALPELAAGTCRVAQRGAGLLRLCAVPFANATLVLGVRGEAERAREALISRALWFGLLSGALLGGLFSYFVARWALAPLTALRDRVRAVDSADPRVELLAQKAAHAEVEELRAAIEGLVARLGASLSQAQGFAAEAAHELRTPLTTIAGELELLAENETLDLAALARVRTQVAALIPLVQRLLILAQPDTPTLLGDEAVDLGDIVSAAHEGLSPSARERVSYRVENDVLVRGDPTLLRALMANALENALKFSSDTVDIEISHAEREARISVRDRGPGIPDSERERVFAPFYRTAGARARGAAGHGLGLALIARVATLHGGSAAFLPAHEGAHLAIRIPAFQSTRRGARPAAP